MTDAPLPIRSLSAAAQHFGAEIQAQQSDADKRAGALAALCFHAAGEGHSCLDLERLNSAYPEWLPNLDAEGLHRLYSANALVCCSHTPFEELPNALLVVFGSRLYLKKFWQMETALIRLLLARLDSKALPTSEDAAHEVAALCRYKRIAFLTGGPGTGKTTAVAAAMAIWLAEFGAQHGRPARIQLCAPTGKAAARLSESWQKNRPAICAIVSPAQQALLPDQASTLHRLLGAPTRGKSDTVLSADLVVVDEASMIDLPLIRRLLQALPEHAHILLIGDPNQLPSIEIGNVLGALLAAEHASELGTSVASAHRHLQLNYRQATSPGLAALAEAIHSENADAVVQALEHGAYGQVLYQHADHAAVAAVCEDSVRLHRQLASMASPLEALQGFRRCIILTPLREGPMGCERLNAEIARRLGHGYNRHGQAILITENVPTLKLANGDVGVVWQQAEGLFVHFEQATGAPVLPLAKLPKHELAYALTIHKAQGSEFDSVDLLLPDTPGRLLSKALLYTAVTRARLGLRITATPNTLKQGLAHMPWRMNGLAAIAAFSETGNTTDCSGSTDSR